MSYEVTVQHRGSSQTVLVTSTTTVRQLTRLSLIAYDLPFGNRYVWAMFLPGSVTRLTPSSIPDYTVTTTFILRHARLPRPCNNNTNNWNFNNNRRGAVIVDNNDNNMACWVLLIAIIFIVLIIWIASV